MWQNSTSQATFKVPMYWERKQANYLPSVIVMDNVPYYSSQLEKILTSKTRKADTLAWLHKKNIQHYLRNTVPPFQNY